MDISAARTGPGSFIAEAARIAEADLPAEVWDFVAGGSGDEGTLADNRAALDRVHVFPRALAGVGEPATETRLFGTDLSTPMAVAPVAYQRLLHPDGELAVATAARDAGIPMVLSTLSSHTIEAVANTGAQTWFQLYWLRNRAVIRDLLRRAEDAGCSAIVLTVDMPVMGRRPRDIRNRFALPGHITAANLPTGAAQGRADGDSTVAQHTNAAFDPSLGWDDLDRVREWSALPLVLKGILHPEDAARAAAHGIDGLIVSNHGGRQFDGAPPSIEALPEVFEAVHGKCPVLFDSGVRSGTDVLRALALGADAVLLGRPVMYGLAAGGSDGVARVLNQLRDELRSDMSLTGCPDLAAVRRLRTGQTAASSATLRHR